MNGKKILVLVMTLGLGTQLIGCSMKNHEKKVVIEEKVTETNKIIYSSNIQSTGKIDILDLNLKEGEEFEPMFYEGREIYGSISKLSSRSNIKPPNEEYPIYGGAKKYLYKLDQNNQLQESEKELGTIFNRGGAGITSIGEGTIEGKDTYMRMDYTVSNSPKELPGLKRAVEKVAKKNNIWWKDCSIDSITENIVRIYVSLEENQPIKKEYIYDITKDKLYESGEKEEYSGTFMYVEGMNSIMFVDDQLNSYKVNLKENSYYLEKYIKLGEISDSEEFGVWSPRENEICIHKYATVLESKYTRATIEETLSIDKYDLSSNKLENLFEKTEGKTVRCLWFNLKGGVGVFEEFNEDKGNIKFKNRYVYRLIDNTMELLLVDNIEKEGLNKYSFTSMLVSEDGKEMFLQTDLYSARPSYVPKKEEITYKRYRLE